MKVKELRKKLEKYDDEQEVAILDSGSYFGIRDVDQIMLHQWIVFLRMEQTEVA